MPVSRRALMMALGAAPVFVPVPGLAQGPALVAVAANLQQVFPRLQMAFEAGAGPRVVPTFGATGNFARQIRQGAPFELLIGADDAIIAALHADGVLPERGRRYAHGRLALVAGRTSPFAAKLEPRALADALAAGRRFRMAIANPEHAPYGRSAMEAVERWQLARAMAGRFVYGENVAQALQLVASGAVETGIIAASLLAGPGPVTSVAAYAVPATDHSPLIQTLALTRRAGDGARRFADFMLSARAQAILREAGFDAADGQG